MRDWPQGGDKDSTENYDYNADGDFEIINGDGTNGDFRFSKYDWRYFWHAGRAEGYAFDNGSTTFSGSWQVSAGTVKDFPRLLNLIDDATPFLRGPIDHADQFGKHGIALTPASVTMA